MSNVITIDQQIFWWAYHLTPHTEAANFLIVACGKFLLYLVIGILAWSVARAAKGKKHLHVRHYLTALLVALGVRFVLGAPIAVIIDRTRPHILFGLPRMLSDFTPSFPSGHATFMFALGTALWFTNKRMSTFILICAVLTGIARVMGAAHFPLDILAGAALGTCATVLVYQCVPGTRITKT